MKHREIVFRSTSQIAGARTVNQLSAFFFDVRKKKGLRISADPFSLMRKIGFVVVLMLGYLQDVKVFHDQDHQQRKGDNAADQAKHCCIHAIHPFLFDAVSFRRHY